MKITWKGNRLPIEKEIVGKATRDIHSQEYNDILILEEEHFDKNKLGENWNGKTIITDIQDLNSKQSLIVKYDTISEIDEGDILLITPVGQTRRLFRVKSNSNSLLVTERCNSNCIMCSQPPKDKNDIPGLRNIHNSVLPLIPKSTELLGITGGEPTLLGKYLFELISKINSHLPETELHILSNGRRLANFSFVEELAGSTDRDKTLFAIPLYSDFYQIHDYVVQSKGAFYQTVQGLRYMGSFDFRIEIRIVLHSIVLPRLLNLLEYIYLNFPFVEHIALMGLEVTGFAVANKHKLWVDPIDYSSHLLEAFNYIESRKMHASIYNIPLCLLDESIWKFSRKSISDWKNDYLPECSKCAKLEECGGIFTTSKFQSENIKAFT